MTETLAAAATAAGLSLASGFRLYMVLFIVGMFGRMGWIALPPGLQVLESPWVLGVTGFLTFVEFLADKVPGLDTVWDAIHTFIRIPAGAMLAIAAMVPMNPTVTAITAILGGTMAAGAHITKASSRALINMSPEPFSNWAASFTEDAAVIAGLWVAFYQPWVLFGVLTVFFLICLWLLPKLWRGLRRAFIKLKSW